MTDAEEQDETMNCGLSVAEREVLQTRLSELDDTVPPREVWQRIEAQARAERLFRPGLLQGTKWFAGAGIAAAVVLTVLNIRFTPLPDDGREAFSDTPPVSVATKNAGPGNLNTLMVQSQQIERDLRALGVQPSLMRASTAATIADLEDRIAAIDYRLNHPAIRLSPDQAEIYWQERVRLMNSLLNLRRAQAQSMTF